MKTVLYWQEIEPEYKDWELYHNWIHFDWHRVLWGFGYESKTYLKESELSWDEYRKGGSVTFTRNWVQVYEQFCRTPERAVFVIAEILPKLQDFYWDKVKIGSKIYWRGIPAFISSIILEQWAIIIKAEEWYTFPDNPWAEEDWEKLEDNTSVKDDIISPSIYWFRN